MRGPLFADLYKRGADAAGDDRTRANRYCNLGCDLRLMPCYFAGGLGPGWPGLVPGCGFGGVAGFCPGAGLVGFCGGLAVMGNLPNSQEEALSPPWRGVRCSLTG